MRKLLNVFIVPQLNERWHSEVWKIRPTERSACFSGQFNTVESMEVEKVHRH